MAVQRKKLGGHHSFRNILSDLQPVSIKPSHVELVYGVLLVFDPLQSLEAIPGWSVSGRDERHCYTAC